MQLYHLGLAQIMQRMKPLSKVNFLILAEVNKIANQMQISKVAKKPLTG